MNRRDRTFKIIFDFITKIFPLVEKELKYWKNKIRWAPDQELAKQGVMSIETKKFHALGGSVFALYNQESYIGLTRVITAYQTISDYLDNLCDRAGVYSQRAFDKLHLSMFHSMKVETEVNDMSYPQSYYQYYPHKDDGGYLDALVDYCVGKVSSFSNYYLVKDDIKDTVKLYRDLQVYKHLKPEIREKKLIEWYKRYEKLYPDIKWWEFSCACGSTLLVFALIALSSKTNLTREEKDKIIDAYFPWICGFHIMLDYYIDQQEDEREGELNLVSFYKDMYQQEERLCYFCERSLEEADKLPRANFHLTVIKGMIALYLSDPKVKQQGFEGTAKKLIELGGINTKLLFYACKVLRACKMIN